MEDMGGDLCLRPSAQRKLYSGALRILPFEEIDAKVQRGEYQFHDFGTCWVWTQITDYGNERVLDVVLLLGDGFVEIKDVVVSHLVRFGKEHGCRAVEALARIGLEPTLKPLGWKKKKVQLRKEIE